MSLLMLRDGQSPLLPRTDCASFRRNDLQAVFVEDSIDFKEVKDLTLDAERKDRILRNDRGQREASRKHPHRTS